MEIRTLFLAARETPSSRLEAVADGLLTPARVLFGGKREVVVFRDSSVHTSDELEAIDNPWKKGALKVLAAIAFPLALLGALLKAFCLLDLNYRQFCSENLIAGKKAAPHLFEIYQEVQDADPQTIPLEEALVNHLALTFKKEHPLRLLSLGIDQVDADLRLLKKLALAGFKHLEIDYLASEAVRRDEEAYQTQYEARQRYEAAVQAKGQNPVPDLLFPGASPADVAGRPIEKINQFFRKYDQALTVQTNFLLEAIPAERNYAAIRTLHLDPASLSDLMKGYDFLAPKGVAAVVSDQENLIFGPSMHPMSFGSKISLIQSQLVESLKNQETLTGFFPYFNEDPSTPLLFLLFLARALKETGKTYQELSIGLDAAQVQQIAPLLSDLFGKETKISIQFLKSEENKNSVQWDFFNRAQAQPCQEAPDFILAPSSKKLDLLKGHFGRLGAKHVLFNEGGKIFHSSRHDVLIEEMQKMLAIRGKAFARHASAY